MKRIFFGVIPSPSRLTFGARIGTEAIRQWLHRWRTLCLVVMASMLLSGCIQSDLAIRFDSPNQGEIVQRIEIGERLRSFSETTIQQWVTAIERRGRRLGGRVQRRSSQELVVTIPFSDGADLETKFNQFFAPSGDGERADALSSPELPAIESHLSIRRSNLLLLERSHLSYDLDLRSLGLSSNGNVLISPTNLLDLEFRLEAPWGARAAHKTTPATRKTGRQLVWNLIPGELNHVEAVFWMPSPLGIGTVLIALLIWVGQFLTASRSPAVRSSPLADTANQNPSL